VTNKLVVENLKHRPLRTLLIIGLISIQVTMVLTLVGLSNGILEDQARRARSVGADIMVRAPSSSVIAFSANMPEKIMSVVKNEPHVVAVTGVLTQGTGGFSYVTGIDLAQFNKLSGGFHFLEGGPFQHADDVMIDSYYATEHKLHVGDHLQTLNRSWRVSGIYEAGTLTRIVVPLDVLQDLTANNGKITMIYVKLDDSSRTSEVIATLRNKLKGFQIYSMEEYTSLFSIANVPMLKQFIWVVIGLGVLVGFLVVFLSMYTAVLERTREIGVLKALGASPGYVLNILLRETTLLAVAGSILGILLSYVTRFAISSLVPGTLIQAIVPRWWPIAAGIALAGALLGAIYPGLKAARQDAVEALSYE
jgi:putative ABC transport system permease protein